MQNDGWDEPPPESGQTAERRMGRVYRSVEHDRTILVNHSRVEEEGDARGPDVRLAASRIRA